MWNDTDHPLAYLITFRAYGTWLHGDDRTSVDRHNNIYGTPRIPHNPRWLAHNERLLLQPPVDLTAKRRNSIFRAIRETCKKRTWDLYALNVRTNHVHAVTAIGIKSPDSALIAFKANATRQMREDKCWNVDKSPWAEKGSKRKLWHERSIERAIDYVLYGQGDDLPNFD